MTGQFFSSAISDGEIPSEPVGAFSAGAVRVRKKVGYWRAINEAVHRAVNSDFVGISALACTIFGAAASLVWLMHWPDAPPALIQIGLPAFAAPVSLVLVAIAGQAVRDISKRANEEESP